MTTLVIESDGGATVVGPATTVPAAPPGAASSAPLLTAEAAQAELRRMMGDRGSPLYHAAHAEHGAATQRFAMLSAVARGQQPAETVAPAAGLVDGDTNAEMLAAGADAPPPADPSGYPIDRVYAPDRGGDVQAEAEDRRQVDVARAWAHEAKLSPAQWALAVAAHADATKATEAGRVADLKATSERGLRALWGADFDKNLARAEAALISGGPELVDYVVRSGLRHHGQFIRMLHDLAVRRGM